MTKFQQVFEHAQQVQRETRDVKKEKYTEALKESNRKDAKKLFARGFEILPKGLQFLVEEIDGVKSMSVFPTPNGGKTLVVDIQGEVPRRNGPPMLVHDTYYVDQKGRITPPPERRIPNIEPEEVLGVALANLSEVDAMHWSETDLALSPEGEQTTVPTEKNKQGEGDEKEKRGNVIELERVALLAKQPGLLARIVNKMEGFRGYRLYVFSTFCVMESDMSGNAAYVIDFDESITQSADEIAAMSAQDRDALIRDLPGAEVITSPRGQKRMASNVLRIVHQGKWQERLQQAIDERRHAPSGSVANPFREAA